MLWILLESLCPEAQKMVDRNLRLESNEKIEEICFQLSSIRRIFSQEEWQEITSFKNFLRSKEDIREIVKL